MAIPVPVPREHPAIKLLNSRATDHDSFITHIDRSPVSTKILAFRIVLCFNIILSGLIAWRAMKGTTQYYSLAFSLYDNFIIKSNPIPINWTWIIINGIVDYSLYHFAWPNVRIFITGHLWLRLRWGFKETEVVFRKPTGWQRARLNGLSPQEYKRQYNDILYRAIDPRFVSQNTGYHTQHDFWTLEYDAVGDAYSMMAAGEVDIKTWDTSVWMKERGEWKVWQVWRLHDEQWMKAVSDITVDKLRVMGKEDLIQQWKSTSRDPSAPITTQLGNDVIDSFRRGGVDFEELWLEAMNEAATRATV